MQSVALVVESITLIVPEFLVEWWPHHLPLDRFPSFCGAGTGVGDVIVPEKNWGLSMSPACFVHDICWPIAQPTWADFHQSNSMFMHNCQALVEARSRFPLKQLRMYRAVTYFNAVDTLGETFFWAEKNSSPFCENPLDHPVVLEKLARVGVFPVLQAA